MVITVISYLARLAQLAMELTRESVGVYTASTAALDHQEVLRGEHQNWSQVSWKRTRTIKDDKASLQIVPAHSESLTLFLLALSLTSGSLGARPKNMYSNN